VLEGQGLQSEGLAGYRICTETRERRARGKASSVVDTFEVLGCPVARVQNGFHVVLTPGILFGRAVNDNESDCIVVQSQLGLIRALDVFNVFDTNLP